MHVQKLQYARITLARETRVGSTLDFQLKRVSAPSCFRAKSLRSSRSSAHANHPSAPVTKNDQNFTAV
ncbi:hypothetical protein CG399_05195 [Bifidobacteriaceae bacterium NR015]|nr:hypothetical protein CG399_05195 [Bifidobacteriaceae bacterium NR015]